MAKTKRKRKKRHDSLVLQLMILVAVVLVVFEGRLVVTMITHRSSMKSTTVTDSTAAAAVQDGTLPAPGIRGSCRTKRRYGTCRAAYRESFLGCRSRSP